MKDEDWFQYSPEMEKILEELAMKCANMELQLSKNATPTTLSVIRTSDIRRETLLSPQSTLKISNYHKLSSNTTLKTQQLPCVTFEHSYSKSSTSPTELKTGELRSNLVLSSSSSIINLNPILLKLRGYEIAAVFEDTFDELDILREELTRAKNNELTDYEQHFDANADELMKKPIKYGFLNDSSLYHQKLGTELSYQILSKSTSPTQQKRTAIMMDKNELNCNPLTLSLAGVFIMSERDKLRYEIENFQQMLMLFFRSLLNESQANMAENFVTNIHNNLLSTQLKQLNERLELSYDKAKKLRFIQKHFSKEKSQKLQLLFDEKAKVKDRLMEENTRAKIALRYCDDWKKNHIAQWNEYLKTIELEYEERIREYENACKQMEIGHKEKVRLLDIRRKEAERNANKWQQKYEDETTSFDKEVVQYRIDLNNILRQRTEMYKEYMRMKQVVQDEREKREYQRKEEEKRQCKLDAIIQIQVELCFSVYYLVHLLLYSFSIGMVAWNGCEKI
ncbi:unnamed protein product [Didymodactylos carnosus]|uniref:Uncharacterized protein n=1 Tax=Didymodactylos carnosus TaxID=1234261 RepID=A0A8S2CZ52_9BILA|nr:unnamed protein product [Didymodactylos carnosus]CAF3555896.1 unnamed protein product [Didymodactylos carnosus]